MTTYVLVHGAWHDPRAWGAVAPILHAAGAHTRIPDLGADPRHGLHDQVAAVVATLDAVPRTEALVLVGHSYAGLVVREAADLRLDHVDHIVLVDGWAGGDRASMFTLAPPAFVQAVRTAAVGQQIPAPPPAAFGITDAAVAARLRTQLRPQPLRTFTEPTHLTGAVDRIPGTAIYCRPQTYAFDHFGAALGYRTQAVDGPHDIMLTDPEQLSHLLLTVRPRQRGAHGSRWR
ncbi:alpha/beta hydrolase [Nocardia puris]|uniref:esterase/lipase family protein n=1 Tax=Nocardia puris TaxID=208602 RepID=UPI0018948233|nr:alpha/beta hydrolase [Nocardia puris]MBF6210381.1 alpha/beta hydrolase [Nocardia puris]MBF6367456.1 alpha/beta hydrolase [Nocardia puris]MBF6457641.1 alpha/beta hydrolase [Nocardia puris]